MTLDQLQTLYAEVRRLEDEQCAPPAGLSDRDHWAAVRRFIVAKNKLPAARERFAAAAVEYVATLLESPPKESS